MTEEANKTASKTDRECLLNGLHTELVDYYDYCYKEGEQEYTSQKKIKGSWQDYRDMPFSFSSTLFEVKRDNETVEKNLKKRRDNQKIVEEKKKEDVYNKNIFVLGKTLNFFNSVVMKICSNNIDKVVVDKFKNTDDIRDAFMWLVIDVSDAENADIQDLNHYD